MDSDCVGIPDLVPGRFIEVTGMGVPVDNQFYLTAVTHDFTGENGYRTHIEGCAAQLKTSV
jgi:phage protein D